MRGAAIVLFVLLLHLPTFGQEMPVEATRSPADLAAEDHWMAVQDTHERLWQSKMDLRVVDQPLNEVIRTIERSLGRPLVINKRSLEDIAMSSDVPVTLTAQRVAIGSVLEMIMSELDLDYIVQPHRLVICNDEEVEANGQVVRYYPIETWFSAEEGNSNLPSMIGAVRLIEPSSWEYLGGPGGHAAIQGGLSIRQPTRVHADLQRLFSALSRAKQLPSEEYDTQSISIHPLAEQAEAVRERLRATKLMIYADEMPLYELAELLQRELGVEVYIDNTSLEDIALSSEIGINGDWENLPAEVILDDLSQLDLGWEVRGDYIRIANDEDLEIALEVRVYPVRDLTAGDQPSIADKVAISSNGLGWCGSGMPGPLSCPAEINVKSPRDQILDMLKQEIEPESWMNLGGAGDGVAFQGTDCLVISQVRPVHDRIVAILHELRESKAISLAEVTRQQASEVVVMTYQVPSHKQGTPTLTPEDLEQLAKAIEATYCQADAGDTSCHVLALSDRLVVRHRREVQLRIYRYLHQIKFFEDPTKKLFAN